MVWFVVRWGEVVCGWWVGNKVSLLKVLFSRVRVDR